MAAPNSRRGKIIYNLIRQLETITVANSYSQDVKEVSSNVKTWDQVTAGQSPTVFVIDEDDGRTYHAGRLVEVDWKVSLYCIMRGETQLAMEEFISDIEQCLSANATLYFTDTGKVINHYRITNVITDNQMFSLVDGSQLFKVTLSLIYTKGPGDR